MKSFDIYGYTFLVASLLLILLVVWQGFKTWQNKELRKIKDLYRKLWEESQLTQQAILVQQQKTQEELSEMKKSIQSIAKILQEID